MKKTIFLLIASTISLCSCSTLYYGYLPGTEYKFLKPINNMNLEGKSFSINFKDNRGDTNRISCSELTLDRKTELEGDLGMQYLSESVISMIKNCNGKIDPNSPDKFTIELEGLSFELIGVGYIVAHGLVQFKVTSASLNKTYCSDMTDSDSDSPLKWYSLTTRQSGSRMMVSGAMRRSVENFAKDLNGLSIGGHVK